MMLYTIRQKIKSSFRIYNQSLIYVSEKTKLDDLLGVVEEEKEEVLKKHKLFK